jgi:excisionase family DNA binding protein
VVLTTEQRLLTAREVAQQLRVSPSTVLRWVRDDKIPGFRLPGGALRFRESDLAEWLGERATNPQ